MFKNEVLDLLAEPSKILDVRKSWFDKLSNVDDGEQNSEFEVYSTEMWIQELSKGEAEIEIKFHLN